MPGPSGPLPVTIDRGSPVPVYQQLADQLRSAITSGAVRPGDPLENELALAARLHVSRPTVRRAIAELDAQGLLVRRRGVGTRVASQVVQPGDTITSLYDDLAGAGRVPLTQVLSLEPGVVHERAAQLLGLDRLTPLLYVERLRYSDSEPLAILRNWLPPRVADITRGELERAGLYALLRARGAAPVAGRQSIRARVAAGADRRLLGMTRADAVLFMARHTWDVDGVPVEYGEHVYRGDQYTFEVDVRP